jgi:PHD/YefM family antitoxin component YafN of YafNO toxin-antitoxin module
LTFSRESWENHGMETVKSEEARLRLRDLLNDVEHKGEHVKILRYQTPTAVLVPVGWYERAKAALGEGED